MSIRSLWQEWTQAKVSSSGAAHGNSSAGGGQAKGGKLRLSTPKAPSRPPPSHSSQSASLLPQKRPVSVQLTAKAPAERPLPRPSSARPSDALLARISSNIQAQSPAPSAPRPPSARPPPSLLSGHLRPKIPPAQKPAPEEDRSPSPKRAKLMPSSKAAPPASIKRIVPPASKASAVPPGGRDSQVFRPASRPTVGKAFAPAPSNHPSIGSHQRGSVASQSGPRPPTLPPPGRAADEKILPSTPKSSGLPRVLGRAADEKTLPSTPKSSGRAPQQKIAAWAPPHTRSAIGPTPTTPRPNGHQASGPRPPAGPPPALKAAEEDEEEEQEAEEQEPEAEMEAEGSDAAEERAEEEDAENEASSQAAASGREDILVVDGRDLVRTVAKQGRTIGIASPAALKRLFDVFRWLRASQPRTSLRVFVEQQFYDSWMRYANAEGKDCSEALVHVPAESPSAQGNFLACFAVRRVNQGAHVRILSNDSYDGCVRQGTIDVKWVQEHTLRYAFIDGEFICPQLPDPGPSHSSHLTAQSSSAPPANGRARVAPATTHGTNGKHAPALRSIPKAMGSYQGMIRVAPTCPPRGVAAGTSQMTRTSGAIFPGTGSTQRPAAKWGRP